MEMLGFPDFTLEVQQSNQELAYCFCAFLSLDFIFIDEIEKEDLSSSLLLGPVGRFEGDCVCVLCFAHS